MVDNIVLKCGAALYSERGIIYVGSTYQNPGSSSFCAERIALLKALQEDNSLFRAMAIYGSSLDTYPYPCGSCRDLMAQQGNFYIVLIKGDGSKKLFRVADLLPNGLVSHPNPSFNKTLNHLITTIKDKETKFSDELDSTYWNTEQVMKWFDSIGYGKYRDDIIRSKITGNSLLILKEMDLERIGIESSDILPIYNQILLLRDTQITKYGLHKHQINDYICLLDKEKLIMVARLKVIFDKHDGDRDGVVNRIELENILKELKLDSNELFLQYLLNRIVNDNIVSFEDFVDAYSMIAQKKEPPEPFQDYSRINLKKRSASEWEAIKRRIQWRR